MGNGKLTSPNPATTLDPVHPPLLRHLLILSPKVNQNPQSLRPLRQHGTQNQRHHLQINEPTRPRHLQYRRKPNGRKNCRLQRNRRHQNPLDIEAEPRVQVGNGEVQERERIRNNARSRRICSIQNRARKTKSAKYEHKHHPKTKNNRASHQHKQISVDSFHSLKHSRIWLQRKLK